MSTDWRAEYEVAIAERNRLIQIVAEQFDVIFDLREEIGRLRAALGGYEDSDLVSLATTLNKREKTLATALKEIKALVSWHMDIDADSNNQSPEDMTAHINGLVWQLCQQV